MGLGLSNYTPRPVASAGNGVDYLNFNPRNLTLARRAFSEALAGLGSMKIVAFGDSTTAGTVGTTGTSGIKSSWPWYFYKELVRRGVSDARFDSLTTANETNNTDGRLVIGAGWTKFSSYMWTNNNLANLITFTPDKAWNKVDVYYYDSSAGTLRVQINSETAVDTTLTGSATLKKVTVAAGSLGLNVFNVSLTNGYFHCADFYDDTKSEVRVLNLGKGGSGLTALDGTPFSVEKLAAQVGGHLYIINMGINDYGTNNPTNWGTKLTTAVTAFKATGSVVIDYPTPSSASDAVQEAHFAQIKIVAAAQGCPVIDLHARYGLTKAEASAAGWCIDALHPTQRCYEDQGRYKANRILFDT